LKRVTSASEFSMVIQHGMASKPRAIIYPTLTAGSASGVQIVVNIEADVTSLLSALLLCTCP
jgi:hypothetical protein